MAEQVIRPRLILLISAIFLALVGLHVWLGSQDKENGDAEGRPELSGIQIAEGERQVAVGPEVTAGELAKLVASRIALLTGGETDERRATALQLAKMAASPLGTDDLVRLKPSVKQDLRQALLGGLNDVDEVVSSNCRNALVGMWRSSDSVAATEQFGEGLLAYEAGQMDRALQAFQSVEQLSASVPPDLYRMKAEVYVAKSMPNEALAECGRALEAEPLNFLALLVVGRIHAKAGDYERALKALDTALSIHTQFREAKLLRQEIVKRQATP